MKCILFNIADYKVISSRVAKRFSVRNLLYKSLLLFLKELKCIKAWTNQILVSGSSLKFVHTLMSWYLKSLLNNWCCFCKILSYFGWSLAQVFEVYDKIVLYAISCLLSLHHYEQMLIFLHFEVKNVFSR